MLTPDVSPSPSPHVDDDAPVVALPSPAQALLTVPQVAELLGMTPKAIYHRAERGQLPGALHVGRSLRFRRADLLRFIGEGRGPSPARSR